MTGRFEDEELIQTKAQQISGVMVKRSRPQPAQPEVEQRQVAQNTMKELIRERAVGRGQAAPRQQTVNDRIGELPPASPFP